MNIAEPVLERYAVFDSYACRKGKGCRAAVIRARFLAGRYPWCLKMDVAKYFDSIDHDILWDRLSRRLSALHLLLMPGGFERKSFKKKGAVQKGSNRVNRNGSWNNDAGNCRSAFQNNNDPSNRNDNNGFRVVLAPAQQGPGEDRC